MISVSQNIYSEKDKETFCRNYPTSQWINYRQCDEDFVHQEMKKRNIVPFWATNNMSEVTSITSKSSGPDVMLYVGGTIKSTCPLPCRTSKVRVFETNRGSHI